MAGAIELSATTEQFAAAYDDSDAKENLAVFLGHGEIGMNKTTLGSIVAMLVDIADDVKQAADFINAL